LRAAASTRATLMAGAPSSGTAGGAAPFAAVQRFSRRVTLSTTAAGDDNSVLQCVATLTYVGSTAAAPTITIIAA
jgi:hypothetical protein